MIYAVIPFQPKKELQNRLDDLDAQVYQAHAPSIYFVAYKGTTGELTSAVGLADGTSGTGVVMPVSNYHGFAAADLWEWLGLHQNGP